MLARLAATAVMLAMPLASADGPHEVLLHIRATTERSSVAPVLDRLADGDVLRVSVDGGFSGSRGTVQQCIRTAGSFIGCINPFPVQFGPDGTASFQYQIEDSGKCGITDSCAIVVADTNGGMAYALTIFGAPAPAPPEVVLSPAGPYAPGATVRVAVATLPPEATLQVAFCDPQCGAIGTAVPDADGRATASIVIGTRCTNCGIAVVGGASEIFVDVAFTPLPTPRYAATRLVFGLAAAAALLIAAWWLIAKVDWRPPSEASTPELDSVEM